MSKKIRRRKTSPFFLSWCALLLLHAGWWSASAQEANTGRSSSAPNVQTLPAQTSIATVTARREALIAATNEVLTETGELRHLPPLQPVKSGVKSREEIKALVVSRLNEESSPQDMHANEAVMRKFGLVDSNFKLRQFLIGLLTEQIAGYYDPRTKEFYLADWIDADAQRLVMSHELTHALQDQHFNLRRFEKWPKGDSDAELAAQALVEGDATLAMSFYAVRNPQRAFGILKSMLSGTGSSEQIDKAPRALRASLLFPYTQGRDWVLEIYTGGGWDAVSAAFKTLPQSTEQILHSDKYLSHEPPVKITLPDLTNTLGSGWKKIEDDVNGEWGYYLILSQFLPDEEDARKAAAGWGGDRFALYEQASTGHLCVVHLSAWDTEQDAREFYEAYAQRSQLRYQTKPPIAFNSNTDFNLPTGEGVVLMQRRGSRVLVIEGVEEKNKSATLELLKKS